MSRCSWIVGALGVVLITSCPGRVPEVDPGDAGIIVDAGPVFDANALFGIRPGTCIEGRWILDDRPLLADERPVLVDCASHGSFCEADFEGCVGLPGGPCTRPGVCRIDTHVDACIDQRCPSTPGDTNGFDAPLPITLPATVMLAFEQPGDRDCYTFDNEAEALVAFTGLDGFHRLTLIDPGAQPSLFWGGGSLVTVPPGPAKVCMTGGGGARVDVRRIGLDELATLERSGSFFPSTGRLCFGDSAISIADDDTVVSTVCDRGCASASGRCIDDDTRCTSHRDCPGACERSVYGFSACGPPIDLRAVDTCVDGRFIGADVTVTCPGTCVHGVGCVHAPGQLCVPGAGFCTDPAGGLFRCVDGLCPALSGDDAPGYHAPARPVTSTAPVTLRSDGPGDVDCVHVVEDEAPTWTPNLVGSGRLEQRQQLRIDGDVVRWDTKLCVSGHDGDVTLTFDP